MTAEIWRMSFLFWAGMGLIAAKACFRYWYPSPKPLGAVLRKLSAVDSSEFLEYRQESEEEWEAKPHLRPQLRRKQLRIYGSYLRQMSGNLFHFEQVLKFEAVKIGPAKSSFEYAPKEVLILDLRPELAAVRAEIFRERLKLGKDWLLGHVLDQDRIQELLNTYKSLEHDMIELASMAADTTCRDMLIERLGLSNWRIIEGGSPRPI